MSQAALASPKEIESEQIVIASELQFSEAVEFAWSRLAPNWLYDERHRLIQQSIHELAAKEVPVSIKTVRDDLERKGLLEKVGLEYLATLPNGVPKLTTLGHYIQEIEKASVQRQGISAAKNFATALMSGNGEVGSATADLEKVIEKLRSNGNGKAPHAFEQLSEDRYKLVIPEARISIEVDRLRRDSHELFGELCVRCELPGMQTYEGIVSIADFNLSSARARKDRGSLLTGRSGSRQLDWTGYLEELCQRVLAAERNGQPAVDLRAIEKPSSDDSIRIAGFILPRRHPGIVFGDGGAAKSYLALYLLGLLAESGLSVAMFDWELAGEDHRERLERLFGRLAMPKILYARCERPLIHEADRLRRIVREAQIDYAVFDSIVFACAGPPESAEIAGQYFRAVRQIGVGSLHVAHVTKGENADQKPFGSAFWHNGARCTWYAKASEASPDGRLLELGLFNRKSNLGRLLPPTGFQVEFTDDRTFFMKGQPADTPELAEKMSIRERMIHLLKGGSIAVDDLAEKIGAKADTIRKTVKRHNRTFLLLEGGQVALLQRVS